MDRQGQSSSGWGSASVSGGWGRSEGASKGVPTSSKTTKAPPTAPRAIAQGVGKGGKGRDPSENFSGRGEGPSGNKAPPSQPQERGLDSINRQRNHGPFNGVEWTALRLPRTKEVAQLSATDRMTQLARLGTNEGRAPLQEGELPPRFELANVHSIETIQNLIDRTSDSVNPGAKDAVDILGDLLNAASRAPLPRHALEDFIREHYDGKPTWAGGKQHKKTAQGVNQTPRGPPPRARAPETPTETSAGSSIPAPAPIVEDVQMEDSNENLHQPTTEEMAQNTELVGNSAPEEATTTNGETPAVVDTHNNVATSGTPSIEERILLGFNIRNPEAALELMTALNSEESPLQDPDPSRWLEMVSPHPGMMILGIPIDELLDDHRTLRRGMLVVLRRLPRPRTVTMLLQSLRALRDRWPEHRERVTTSPTASPVEMMFESLNNPDSIIAHFVQHPVNTSEMDDLTRLLEYIGRGEWGF